MTLSSLLLPNKNVEHFHKYKSISNIKLLVVTSKLYSCSVVWGIPTWMYLKEKMENVVKQNKKQLLNDNKIIPLKPKKYNNEIRNKNKL